MGEDGQTVDETAAISIVEALGDIVWVRDAKTGELLYVSKNARAFLGLARDMPYDSATFLEAVHPDDRTLVVEAFANARDAYSIDFRFHRQGEVRWACTRGRNFYDEMGERIRVEGWTSDITARIAREEDLRAKALRAEALARVAERLSARTSLDDAMRMVCEEAAGALGAHAAAAYLYDPRTGDLVAKFAHGLRGGASDPAVAPYEFVVDAIRARGRVGQLVDILAARGILYEDRIRASDVRSIGYAAIMHGEDLLGVLNVITYEQERELTHGELALLKGIADQAVGPLVNARLFADKERAEERLRASERRYREIVETKREGIGVVEPNGVVTFCNARMAEILDTTADVIIGLRYTDVVSMDEPERLAGDFAARVAGSGAVIERKIRTRTGRELWVTSAVTRVIKLDGSAELLVVLSDVTEARRLAEKLQNAQKAESLGVLAGGVAHDFNNLLVSMLGNAGFALVELPPESAVRGVIEDIQTAALRASELTRQLLAYSGRGRFVIARLDLGRVVEEMAHLLTAVISKNVILKYSFAKNLPMIEGDPTQIRQIVMNLITNASDAIAGRSGIVTVATSLLEADRAYLSDTYLDDELPPGFYVCMEVSDTGVGMAPETRARIFDPFFSTKFTGRGLGLAAALGILRAHRGAIKVYSEPGRGSTFKVLFPALDAAHDATTASVRPMSMPMASGTLLVVDDDASVRAVVKRILVRHGFDVLVAADGHEAIDVYREHGDRILAVILDVTMPNMGGEETFRQLRQMDGDVRVLLASGYSEQEATSRFAGKGLAGFIAKPFTPSDLLERIQSVLSR